MWNDSATLKAIKKEDGFGNNGYFIPTWWEMQKIYNNRAAINTALFNLDRGGFLDYSYMTSSIMSESVSMSEHFDFQLGYTTFENIDTSANLMLIKKF